MALVQAGGTNINRVECRAPISSVFISSEKCTNINRVECRDISYTHPAGICKVLI